MASVRIIVVVLIGTFGSTCIAGEEPQSLLSRILSFEGGGYGVGLSYIHDMGKEDRVEEAEVIDGIVRVSHKRNGIVRPILEVHGWHTKPCPNRTGKGWFIAVQSGADNIASSLSAGFVMGVRREKDTGGLNIGLGFSVDPDTQVLGEGLDANKPLPGSEMQVRYKKETQYGVTLMFSIGK